MGDGGGQPLRQNLLLCGKIATLAADGHDQQITFQRCGRAKA